MGFDEGGFLDFCYVLRVYYGDVACAVHGWAHVEATYVEAAGTCHVAEIPDDLAPENACTSFVALEIHLT